MQPIVPYLDIGVFASYSGAPSSSIVFLGWSYRISFAVIAGLHGKITTGSHLSHGSGAGSVLFEHAVDRTTSRWLKPVSVVLILTAERGLPRGGPSCPVDKYIAYRRSSYKCAAASTPWVQSCPSITRPVRGHEL